MLHRSGQRSTAKQPVDRPLGSGGPMEGAEGVFGSGRCILYTPYWSTWDVWDVKNGCCRNETPCYSVDPRAVESIWSSGDTNVQEGAAKQISCKPMHSTPSRNILPICFNKRFASLPQTNDPYKDQSQKNCGSLPPWHISQTKTLYMVGSKYDAHLCTWIVWTRFQRLVALTP